MAADILFHPWVIVRFYRHLHLFRNINFCPSALTCALTLYTFNWTDSHTRTLAKLLLLSAITTKRQAPSSRALAMCSSAAAARAEERERNAISLLGGCCCCYLRIPSPPHGTTTTPPLSIQHIPPTRVSITANSTELRPFSFHRLA